jgi:hypothetical protein
VLEGKGAIEIVAIVNPNDAGQMEEPEVQN